MNASYHVFFTSSGKQRQKRAGKPKMTAVAERTSFLCRGFFVISYFLIKALTTAMMPAKKLSGSNIHGEIAIDEQIPSIRRTPRTVRRNWSSFFSESYVFIICCFCCRFLSRSVVAPCVRSSPTSYNQRTAYCLVIL